MVPNILGRLLAGFARGQLVEWDITTGKVYSQSAPRGVMKIEFLAATRSGRPSPTRIRHSHHQVFIHTHLSSIPSVWSYSNSTQLVTTTLFYVLGILTIQILPSLPTLGVQFLRWDSLDLLDWSHFVKVNMKRGLRGPGASARCIFSGSRGEVI